MNHSKVNTRNIGSPSNKDMENGRENKSKECEMHTPEGEFT